MDGVEQPAPKRTGTLTGMPAAPRLPGELAPTQPAPNPLKKTWRVPTPPSAVALARRSDPPTGDEAPAPADAAAGQLDATLPPPSADPSEASLRAQRRALEAKDARLGQLEQERQRLALELEIERQRQRGGAAGDSVPPKGWSDPKVIKAVLALLTALAGLGTPLGIWLTAKATALESAQQRQDRTAKEATATASSAKAESSSADKEITALKEQIAKDRAYNREVFRRLGVEYPARPGDPNPPELQTQTPVRKPGAVTPAPLLVVTTPPP